MRAATVSIAAATAGETGAPPSKHTPSMACTTARGGRVPQPARQRYRLRQPERMGGAEGEVARQIARGDVETVDAAGRAHRRGGIHQHQGGRALPFLQQRQRVTVAFQHAGGAAAGQQSRHQRPGRVVAAVGIAETDDQRSHRGAVTGARSPAPDHPRFTFSLRKWVAQEMQGSWLRTAASQASCSAASG